MSERIKDRVLILRVKSKKLESTLRRKMKETSTGATRPTPNKSITSPSPSNSTVGSSLDVIVDLPGVNIVPSSDNSTLWWFTCDSQRYPCRLTNLPLPIELHRTVDHQKYYKSVDLGQMLIVYENEKEMDEEENSPHYRNDSFPSYYHSGITPPMKRVLDRRFAVREHSIKAPPKYEVAEVEQYLKKMISIIDVKKTKKNASQEPKVIEEIEDELCDWEPWMGNGVEFKESDALCKDHPEVWLPPAPRGTYYPIKTKSKKDKKQKEAINKPKVNLAKLNKVPDSAQLDPVVASAMEIANSDIVENMDFDDFGFNFEGETFDLDGI